MKRCLIISLSLCSILLYGCGSASDSSQDENPKAEESVIVQQTTETLADGNEVNDEISKDVGDDIDNIGLPYNGAYDDNMGFNLDGVDYHFPVTPNEILAYGSYEVVEVVEAVVGDSDVDSVDSICRPGSNIRLEFNPDDGHRTEMWVRNRTDAPLKVGDCEIYTIGYTGWPVTEPDILKLTNLDGYGILSGTKSDILQAYGTPDDSSENWLMYEKKIENGIRYWEYFNFFDDGECRCVSMKLQFPED